MTSSDHLRAAARCWERAGFYEDAAERFTRAEAWHDAGRCFSQAERHHDAALAYSRAEEPLLETRQYLMSRWPERARSLFERLRLAPFLSPREEVEVLLSLGEVEAAQRVAIGPGDREAVATFARLAATRDRPDLAAPFWSQTDAPSWGNRSLRWQLPPPVVEAAKVWPSVEFSEVSLVPIWEEETADHCYGDPAIDWSADSSFFAAALRDNGIARGRIGMKGIRLERWQLSGRTLCVSFVPGSLAVLTGAESGEVLVVEENGSIEKIESLQVPGSAFGISFNLQGDRVAIAVQARNEAILKISSWQENKTTSQLIEIRQTRKTNCWPLVTWSPDGSQLFWSPGPDGRASRLLQVDQQFLKTHAESISSLAFTPNWHLLITTDRNGTLAIRSGLSGQRIAPLEHFGYWVNGASVHPHPQAALVAVGEGKCLHLLRLQDGEPPRLTRLSKKTLDEGVKSLAFSPDGRHLLVFTGDYRSGHLHLFRVDLKP